MTNITADKLEVMTTWAQTATLPQLIIEMRKTAVLETYADKNMEAMEMLSEVIITRFNR